MLEPMTWKAKLKSPPPQPTLCLSSSTTQVNYLRYDQLDDGPDIVDFFIKTDFNASKLLN